MKKFIKYSLYGLIYLFIVFILAIIFMNSAKSELVKPNNSIEPYQVVKIQLRGLKNNDESKKINVYSFALKPEEHQPSGTCNFSRIDNARLVTSGTALTTSENTNCTTTIKDGTILHRVTLNLDPGMVKLTVDDIHKITSLSRLI